MKKVKKGKVDYSALNKKPEDHELYAADYFAELGFDVVFIRPSNIKGSRSPDFTMAGKIWELKSPTGKSERTFEDDLRKAMGQSEHIIFDLRQKAKRDETWCINKLKNQSTASEIKTLLAINKQGKLLIIKGKFGIM